MPHQFHARPLCTSFAQASTPDHPGFSRFATRWLRLIPETRKGAASRLGLRERSLVTCREGHGSAAVRAGLLRVCSLIWISWVRSFSPEVAYPVGISLLDDQTMEANECLE